MARRSVSTRVPRGEVGDLSVTAGAAKAAVEAAVVASIENCSNAAARHASIGNRPSHAGIARLLMPAPLSGPAEPVHHRRPASWSKAIDRA
jgi:hypothetical protein